jgi:hypothetical protein
LELIGAASSIDQMRVTIDQAGSDPAARQIMGALRSRRQFGWNLAIIADPDDPVSMDCDRSRLHDVARIVGRTNSRIPPKRQRVGRIHVIDVDLTLANAVKN